MKTIRYTHIANDSDDAYLAECLCNDGTESLEIDYDANTVHCNVCGHMESNWLIKNLIELYAPIIDKDCEEQIKSFYYPENVEREEREINRSIDFLKTARL